MSRSLPPPRATRSSARAAGSTAGQADDASGASRASDSDSAPAPRGASRVATPAPLDGELALLGDLDEAVIRLDEAGRLLYANDSARSLLGTSPVGDPPGQPLAAAAPWLAEALLPALAATASTVVDVRDERRGRWLGCRVHPVAGGVVVLIEDMALRQLADLERQRLLASPTAEPTPDRIAHKFNNAIMALVGNVELMQLAASRHPELQESMAEVRAAAERSLTLARQLVECSRAPGAAAASGVGGGGP